MEHNWIIGNFFIIQKTSIMVGGQAVMEGVMMRVPGFYATAVRSKDSNIIIDRHQFVSLVETYKLEKIIIIRGFCHLIDSMKIGFQSLDWSSKISEESANSTNKIIDFFDFCFIYCDQPPGADPKSRIYFDFLRTCVFCIISSSLKTALVLKPDFLAFRAQLSACIEIIYA